MAIAGREQIAAWVEAARQGDRAAFGELVRQFQDAAAGVVVAHLGPGPDVEDVTQDAFVAAYRQLSQLRAPAVFGAWVCRIARNLALRCLRDRRRGLALSGDIAAPAERRASDLGDRVTAAIQGLPLRLREPLTLFYINGYSTEEVAGLLELPAGTVRRRLHEARNRLRQHMETAMEERIKRNAPKPEFVEKVTKAFEVCSGKDEQSGTVITVSMVSSDPSFTEGEAGRDYQEVMDLFHKGEYKFLGIREDKGGVTTYLYRFRRANGTDVCFGCSEPIEQFMDKLAKLRAKK